MSSNHLPYQTSGLFFDAYRPQTLATLITQSLEYFLHPDMGLLGTNSIGLPMAVAQVYFQYSNARELLWFDVLFERMRVMKTGLGGFLREMARGGDVRSVRHQGKELRRRERRGGG